MREISSPFLSKEFEPNSNSSQKKGSNPGEFHLFAAPLTNNAIQTTFPTFSQQHRDGSLHTSIQNSWVSFNGLNDSQRNQMLKGLIHRCSTKQIEYICTLLNLKWVDEYSQTHASFYI